MRPGWLILTVFLGGCGAEFYLSTPDTAGVPGQTAPLVVRLARSELWQYAPPLKEAAIIFTLDGQIKSAKTDPAGYSAVGFELPKKPGRYEIAIHHQDPRGDTVSGAMSAYVLSPDRPVVTVDLDSLPLGGWSTRDAVGAVKRLAASAQIVYISEQYAARPRTAHKWLDWAGYPDGPVLPYVKIRPKYDYRSWTKQPERRALIALRDNLPEFVWGVAAADDAAETFRKAGLKVMGVVDKSTRKYADQFFPSWAEVDLPPPAGPTTAPAAARVPVPTAAPATAPAPLPTTKPATEPTTEAVAEPATAPAPLPTTEPATEPAMEAVAEPATAPAPLPTTEPATEPTVGPS